MAFYIILTALPLYLADKLNAGADQAGLLVTLLLVAAIIIRPFAGRWVSYGSQKKVLIVQAASAFFTLYAIFMIICRPFKGRWADRFEPNIIVYHRVIIFAIGMFLLQSSQLAAIIMISGAFIGMGYGSCQPIFQTLIINSVDRVRVGIANSLYFNSQELGMAIGAAVLGVITNSFVYRSIFIVGLVLIIVAGIEYFTFASRKKSQ